MRPVGSKYLLEEPMGRGATGTVWRARQRETAGAEAAVAGEPGELVAIKVLKEELANDADVVMRFLRERSVLLRLTHPNIVRTRDLVVEGDLLALVMDLINGPDLHRYLRENGPLSPVGAALLTAQVADALAASHADGVVHRDLKPANVLITEGEHGMSPMLTDFGIARIADSPGLTRTHEFVGTPAYVAPESAEGKPQTSAVDIYGAGILLYELLTGQPPFGGGSTLEVLHRHLSEQPRRPEQVPEPLWTVIEHCLRKRPEERPGAENLARALRTVASGIAPGAAPEQYAAALGVAGLLAPDPQPAPVPGSGGPGVVGGGSGDAEPTQVLPTGSGADPHGATSVLPQTGPGQGQGAGTDATSVMPPVSGDGGRDGAGDGGGDGAHPWQNQMRAARDRNDQTQYRPLDPSEDPLRRRPPRRPAPQQQPPPRAQHQQPPPDYGRPRRQQYQDGYGQQGHPPHQGYQGGYQPQPQRYEPEPPPRRQQRPPEPEPRRPREPRQRSANPMRIPGLGCLKGCLMVILVFALITWLVWNFTPVQDWIADGQAFWDTVVGWYESVRDGVKNLTN
ncbi:serine/threonine protein kinase [Streptomyces sp. XM4193]|uniref:serine/threonine-protein kinase n=1 Tax=Streptomyces sp. XM4193 TaxID=2929782 RepID=UPI001FF89070|nr:serine/threonine-protein kinase [Streptomyces sp. XM4193]MCK1798442.1 serine/threonine protein kinase [Streptomyces sp. XM4193]